MPSEQLVFATEVLLILYFSFLIIAHYLQHPNNAGSYKNNIEKQCTEQPITLITAFLVLVLIPLSIMQAALIR